MRKRYAIEARISSLLRTANPKGAALAQLMLDDGNPVATFFTRGGARRSTYLDFAGPLNDYVIIDRRTGDEVPR